MWHFYHHGRVLACAHKIWAEVRSYPGKARRKYNAWKTHGTKISHVFQNLMGNYCGESVLSKDNVLDYRKQSRTSLRSLSSWFWPHSQSILGKTFRQSAPHIALAKPHSLSRSSDYCSRSLRVGRQHFQRLVCDDLDTNIRSCRQDSSPNTLLCAYNPMLFSKCMKWCNYYQ